MSKATVRIIEPDLGRPNRPNSNVFSLLNSSFAALSVSTAQFNVNKSCRKFSLGSIEEDTSSNDDDGNNYNQKVSALQSELEELRIKHEEDAVAHKMEISRLERKIHQRDVRLELAAAVATDAAALRIELSRLQHEVHKRDVELEHAAAVWASLYPEQKHSIKDINIEKNEEDDDHNNEADVCPKIGLSCASLDTTISVKTEVSSVVSSLSEHKDYNKLVERLKKELAAAEEEKCRSDVEMATALCCLEDKQRKEIMEYEAKIDEKNETIHRLEETSKETEKELASMCRQYEKDMENINQENAKRELKLQNALREEHEKNMELEKSVLIQKEQVKTIKSLCRDIVKSYQEELDETKDEYDQMQMELTNKLVVLSDQKQKMEREFKQRIESQKNILRLFSHNADCVSSFTGCNSRRNSYNSFGSESGLPKSSGSVIISRKHQQSRLPSSDASKPSKIDEETCSVHNTTAEQILKEHHQDVSGPPLSKPLFQWYNTTDVSPLMCTVGS